MSALELSDDYPELLALIARSIDADLSLAGVDPVLSASAAFNAAEAVRQAVGGAQIYVSQGIRWQANKRNIAVVEALSALPYSDAGRYARVAVQFKLSERWVRNIEQSWLEEERSRRQLNLLDS